MRQTCCKQRGKQNYLFVILILQAHLRDNFHERNAACTWITFSRLLKLLFISYFSLWYQNSLRHFSLAKPKNNFFSSQITLKTLKYFFVSSNNGAKSFLAENHADFERKIDENERENVIDIGQDQKYMLQVFLSFFALFLSLNCTLQLDNLQT